MEISIKDKVVLGQEVICPDGYGRVIDFKDDFPDCWIKVKTYVNDRSCMWANHNVKIAGGN